MADRDEAREQIAEALVESIGAQMPPGWVWLPDLGADAVLDVPAVADALAAVERVRALAADIDYCWDDEYTTVAVVVAALDRALSGAPTIQRETVEDALENDRCGICGSVDHFREDHPNGLT